MDKKKPGIVKSAKKIARLKIEVSLTAHLNTLTAEFGPASKKLKKEIAKGAKKLAKQLTKQLTLAKPAEPAKVVEAAPAATAEVKKPAAKPAATKVTAAKPEKAAK